MYKEIFLYCEKKEGKPLHKLTRFNQIFLYEKNPFEGQKHQNLKMSINFYFFWKFLTQFVNVFMRKP